MLYKQVIPTVTIVATTIFLITALFFPAFIGSVFTQAESMNQSMYNTTDDSGNETVQIIGQSANQTGNSIQQGTNQTGEAIQGNASDVGANISEGAQNLGSNLSDVAKGLAKTIGKGLQDLSK